MEMLKGFTEINHDAVVAGQEAMRIVSKNIASWEGMSEREIAKCANEIYELAGRIFPKLSIPVDKELKFFPRYEAVLTRLPSGITFTFHKAIGDRPSEVTMSRARELLDEWALSVCEAPDNVYHRFKEILNALPGNVIAANAIEKHETENASKAAEGRWSRLVTVKEWAFEQRRANPTISRAALIRQIAPEIKKRAKAANEPLTGSDQSVTDTITRWFREAKIK